MLIDDVWSGGSKDGVNPETGKRYPLMSYAISKGLYHPRCKDSHTTYFPGISTTDDTWTKEELENVGLQSRQEARQQYAKRQKRSTGDWPSIHWIRITNRSMGERLLSGEMFGLRLVERAEKNMRNHKEYLLIAA